MFALALKIVRFLLVILVSIGLLACAEPVQHVSNPATETPSYVTSADNYQQSELNYMPDPLGQIRHLIAQTPALFDPTERQENLDQIWIALLELPTSALQQTAVSASEEVLQGWLTLLQLYQSGHQTPFSLHTDITDWQKQYSWHPTAQLLPTHLRQIVGNLSQSPAKIALVLPLSGQARAYSQAIEQGFSAATRLQTTPPAFQPTTTENSSAAYSDEVFSHPTSMASSLADPAIAPAISSPPNESPPEIKIYDSSSVPLPTLLKQLEQDGITQVVGPLLKPEVAQLSAIDTFLNILALNQPEVLNTSSNICYFSLSPEDEAQEAARRIQAQGKQQPLVLVPKGAFGERIAYAFAQRWRQEGNQTAALVQNFGSHDEMRNAINRGLAINLTGQTLMIEDESNGIRDLHTSPLDNTRVNTQEVDAVYIVATAAEIMLIKPRLDMNNHVNRPALYASSRIHQSAVGRDYRLELEGLEYTDIPLLSGAYPKLEQQLNTQFNQDYMLIRLYAMGMDAWNLANHFAQVQQGYSSQFNGYTGVLSTEQNCVIKRKPSWLRFQGGDVVAVL